MNKFIPVTLAALSTMYLIFAVQQLAVIAPGTQAQDTDSLGWLDTFEDDGFWNFDFKSQSAVDTNVDWPLRFVFRDNAEIDKVKDKIDGCGGDPSISPETCGNGGPQRFYSDDGAQQYPGVYWDADSGKKESDDCQYGANHIRLYAQYATDRNYNSVWGYYVFGTVHLDYENGATYYCTVYYSSESQETWWRNRFTSSLGWSVDTKNFYNYDAGDWDTYEMHAHYTASSGYGSFIYVP